MGSSIPWVSDAASGFNSEYGFSSTEEQTRELLPLMLENGTMPSIVKQNAPATGTDPVGYLSEAPGFTPFVLDDGVVYHTTRVRRGSSGPPARRVRERVTRR